jgi:hypothetical protein
MKTYSVTIQATITKTIAVHAEDADQAAELAHEQFDVTANEDPERYEQDTIRVELAR